MTRVSSNFMGIEDYDQPEQQCEAGGDRGIEHCSKSASAEDCEGACAKGQPTDSIQQQEQKEEPNSLADETQSCLVSASCASLQPSLSGQGLLRQQHSSAGNSDGCTAAVNQGDACTGHQREESNAVKQIMNKAVTGIPGESKRSNAAKTIPVTNQSRAVRIASDKALFVTQNIVLILESCR
jgi:hypothetical protein